MSPPLPVAPSVSIEIPQNFAFGPTVLDPIEQPVEDGTNGTHGDSKEHPSHLVTGAAAVPVTSLDVLANFKGTFRGFGFNTIFRPDNKITPTHFPVKPTDTNDDNVLQLNLTSETMTFGNELGNVPNRGLGEQADIMLNGVPYTQTILDAMPSDVLSPCKPPVIHFEPGLWMRVPEVATMPDLAASFNRMASIPHGTTINAQCFGPAVTHKGPPVIPSVGITPVFLPTGKETPFASQTASDKASRRLPQDLTPFEKDGTITQEILNDPNTVLRNANKGKHIVEHTTFTVTTASQPPNLGGGTSNIGFNIGADDGAVFPATPKERSGNANATKMTAQYWISKVRAEIRLLPCMEKGDVVSPVSHGPRDAVPQFVIDRHHVVTAPKTITVEYTQIQYSQFVALDFNGLGWPHVSVATLAPTKHFNGPKLKHVVVGKKTH
ncbi:uncharacterized protein NECHADRAFT_82514 [Fusarium vanettenii 77-13-4]|uniref:Uncharacterized protein n=1 Tax=Fusarium vanettenii (strain ATCC MYA-4622 / CBS 123669 / FGSC 9596 / NRRL 45880 / 77-13-4) TaxID=660122 RepID=C7YXF8_FUSV7|nr:uncharacterized protein NECHADRAFT_82514 [Fusarium vanettenii 77-13-4]EEU43582.1 hypothetical protein NECHADRAFT_82514 [Fusarium vanettenii 77-13-4]